MGEETTPNERVLRQKERVAQALTWTEKTQGRSEWRKVADGLECPTCASSQAKVSGYAYAYRIVYGHVSNGIVGLVPTGSLVVMIFIREPTTTLKADNTNKPFTRKNGDGLNQCLTKNLPKLKLSK